MSEPGAPGGPSRSIIAEALLAGHGLETVEQRAERLRREGYQAARKELMQLVGDDAELGEFVFRNWEREGRTKGLAQYLDDAKRELGRV